MKTVIATNPQIGTRPTTAAVLENAGASESSTTLSRYQKKLVCPTDTSVISGVRWQEIPIFIVNRNRYTALRRMIEWLKDFGAENICILDNASSYGPLLDWYDNAPSGVRLVRLGENFGPHVFWKRNIHKKLGLPYVLTDSDLVPADYCPGDLIAKLQETLCRFPDAHKVGPSLRIDNLTTAYAQAETAFKWESQFWERPIAHGLFAAPIDTKFALYAPSVDFCSDQRNIRMGYPYTMEHTPWTVDDAALTEEELYYRANTSQEFSHWSGNNQLTERLSLTNHIKGFDQRARVLHLGGGDEYIPGWINIDSRGRKLDAVFGFEQCGSQRLPLADDSIDGIDMSHSLQRVFDVPSLLRELYRVARHDAKLFMRVPHGASSVSFGDPRSVRPWFEDSFNGFAAPVSRDLSAGYDWHVVDRTLLVARDLMELDGAELDSQVRNQRGKVREMCVTLCAVKPTRGANHMTAALPPIRMSTDERLEPNFQR